MFIHLEDGIDILEKDIIAILDYELFKNSVIMDAFKVAARKENKLVGFDKDAKSAVITTDKVYFSSLSVATLKKRASVEAILSQIDDYSDDLMSE